MRRLVKQCLRRVKEYDLLCFSTGASRIRGGAKKMTNHPNRNRNYLSPSQVRDRFGLVRGDIESWSDTRETSVPVAYAIHAISDKSRSPEEIWADPTPTECGHVMIAVTEYVRRHDFPANDDGRYFWGEDTITI